ncbi:hypothetical protein PENTCL1PPCAC_26236, partial [Pristionchus entomophagus]
KDKKPFECEICKKRFTQTSTLNEHKRTHLANDHPLKGKVECDICGKMLCDRNALATHKETHLDDNDPQQVVVKRPFKCDECGKSFRAALNLKHH